MKYLIGLFVSAMLLLAMVGPTINIHFVNKVFYNKETPKEKRRKEHKINIIIWAIFTIVEFIFIIVFGHN